MARRKRRKKSRRPRSSSKRGWAQKYVVCQGRDRLELKLTDGFYRAGAAEQMAGNDRWTEEAEEAKDSDSEPEEGEEIDPCASDW